MTKGCFPLLLFSWAIINGFSTNSSCDFFKEQKETKIENSGQEIKEVVHLPALNLQPTVIAFLSLIGKVKILL